MKTIKITDSPKLKTSQLMQQMRDRFKVWSYYSNEELDKQFPPPKKATTRYFADTVEADEDLKNKSAKDLEKEKIPCITLRERLQMEIEHWDKTKTNLDIDNITLCAGSRFVDGFVPFVCRRRDGVVCVFGPGSRGASPFLRARRAVSLNSCDSSVPSDLESRVAKLESDMDLVRKHLIL